MILHYEKIMQIFLALNKRPEYNHNIKHVCIGFWHINQKTKIVKLNCSNRVSVAELTFGFKSEFYVMTTSKIYESSQ